jgi:3-oxoacyl-[acyl-carrier protein] reductase
VLVNAVAPGLVPTTMTQDLLDVQRDYILTRTPLGRAGTTDEIAAVVGFLASDGASYVNGQILYVDGGLTA